MAGLPDFLTVEEAARVLRIGRTAAYELARRFEATEGQEGIPVVRVGRLMRVPRAALERWAGGPLSHPNGDEPKSRKAAPRRRRSKSKGSQEPLPLDGLRERPSSSGR